MSSLPRPPAGPWPQCAEQALGKAPRLLTGLPLARHVSDHCHTSALPDKTWRRVAWTLYRGTARLQLSREGQAPGTATGYPGLPPTLLIHDLRLHRAFLLFTASHSRRWPAGRKGQHCWCLTVPPGCCLPILQLLGSRGCAHTRHCPAQ